MKCTKISILIRNLFVKKMLYLLLSVSFFSSGLSSLRQCNTREKWQTVNFLSKLKFSGWIKFHNTNSHRERSKQRFFLLFFQKAEIKGDNSWNDEKIFVFYKFGKKILIHSMKSWNFTLWEYFHVFYSIDIVNKWTIY